MSGAMDARYTCTLCEFDSGWIDLDAMPAVREEHLAHHAAARQGAPRQALTITADGSSIETASLLRELGIAVTVGTLVPTGSAVRLAVDADARWLEPHEAHALASALNEAATIAVHEDRAARRG